MSEPIKAGKKKLAPHWYRIYQDECVLCGRGGEWRERMFTPKPADPMERYKFEQRACPEHFI